MRRTVELKLLGFLLWAINLLMRGLIKIPGVAQEVLKMHLAGKHEDMDVPWCKFCIRQKEAREEQYQRQLTEMWEFLNGRS